MTRVVDKSLYHIVDKSFLSGGFVLFCFFPNPSGLILVSDRFTAFYVPRSFDTSRNRNNSSFHSLILFRGLQAHPDRVKRWFGDDYCGRAASFGAEAYSYVFGEL